jgi:hypothetical protein
MGYRGTVGVYNESISMSLKGEIDGKETYNGSHYRKDASLL